MRKIGCPAPIRPPLSNAGFTQTTRPPISAATSISACGRTVPPPRTGMAPVPAATGSVTANGVCGGGSRRSGSGCSETRKPAAASDTARMATTTTALSNRPIYSLRLSACAETGSVRGPSALSGAVQAPPRARWIASLASAVSRSEPASADSTFHCVRSASRKSA